MAKEWILNSATNRFQLNFSRNVGRVSEQIRLCQPRNVNDWENYYYKKVYPKSHLTELGKKLYTKITEVLIAEIEPAPDEWDRLFNVDFFIKIKDKYIGLQIKPAGGVSHIPQIFQEKQQQAQTHKKFTSKYIGKVFYIISIKEGDKKRIHNIEVIDEIKEEIKRLS